MSDTIISPSPDPALHEVAYREVDFPALRLARSSRRAKRIAKWLLVVLAVWVVAMLFVPWQQTIKGAGSVVAFDPVDRPQAVESPVKGVIEEIGEGIYENAEVKKGQLIYRIVDQDPQYLQRLEQQVTNTEDQLRATEQRLERLADQLSANQRVVNAKRDELNSVRAGQVEALAAADAYVQMAQNKLVAERAGLTAAEDTVWQADLDYKRKKRLNDKGFESGLKYQESDLKLRQAKAKQSMAEQYVEAAKNELSGKQKDRDAKQQQWQAKINKTSSELEKAVGDVSKTRIDIAKASEEQSKIKNDLQKLNTQVARQQMQEVKAPRDGYIMRLIAYDKSAMVKQGDPLFTIVPTSDKPAVQIWVNGNDAPLIGPGRHVRLQFEGWPAAQFSGWPNVAIGTFGGEVALVDPTDDGAGKFRVLVIPDETDQDWPEYPYLRQGVLTYGWVLLDRVPLGYELWRRMNGFPPALKSKADAENMKPPKIKI